MKNPDVCVILLETSRVIQKKMSILDDFFSGITEYDKVLLKCSFFSIRYGNYYDYILLTTLHTINLTLLQERSARYNDNSVAINMNNT